MARGLCLLLLISATTIQVFGQTWDVPYFLDPGNVEGVTLDPGDSARVYFDEELPLHTRAVKLNYIGDVTPTVTRPFPTPPNGDIYLGAEFVVGDGGYWYLEVTLRQDFEASYFVGEPNYFFEINIGTQREFLNIIIINMDDNRPTIEPEVANCLIQEGPLEDFNVDELKCFYRIFDLDGHMANITNRITHNLHPNIEEFFQFIPNPEVPADVTVNNMSMSLIPLKALDFETTSIYVLNWLVKDTNATETVLRVVVEVDDIADTPPRWTSIFASRQFDEKEPQQFNVIATDGDIVINDDITYEVTFPGQDWSDLISIDYNSGQIDVNAIDRDALQIETYIFTVHACELNMPEECVEQDITFLVNDLNDNLATITVTDDDFTLTLDESTVSTIETAIIVNDIDLGVNAQYTIELTSEDGIEYHRAFSVAPNSGYQQTSVYLFITNPAQLDYEDDNWQQFSFNLVATGIENNTHVHTVTFKVQLTNLNDESPIFLECNDHPETTLDECVVVIKETFEGLTDLVAMEAKDRDIGDWVTHRLLGSYAQRILTIDGDNGQITTANLSRPFDYETLQEIIIQVQALDNLEDKNNARNTAVSQLTIRLTDVNDETPIISVSSILATMKENLATGTEILNDEGFTIEAMDDDTDAELSFEINWEFSFALKNGVNIGENFTYYIGCVEIETIRSEGTSVAAKLTIVETVEDNTPDYEMFDTLHLTVVAIDRNQEVGEDRASVTIPILINDLNDNKPVFDKSTTTAEMTVRENSEAGTMIAVVTATDADIGTSLTYTLKPRDDTAEGLVSIVAGTGQLRVDGTKNIDADIPLYDLYYTVTASDGKWTTDEDIIISVIDVNDNDPIFEATPTLEILEKSDHGTHIHTFLATDQDRDEVNRAVVYRFRESTINLQFRSFFAIDETTGDFIVFYETDQMLDRDRNIPTSQNGLLNMEIVASNTDQLALSSFTEVTVVLIDINDQVPQLDTETFTAREDDKAGDSVGTIHATDDDDPETIHTDVTFEIKNIKAKDETFEESLTDLFILEDEDINVEDRTAILYVGRDLEGYHGEFTVTIEMKDFGEIRNENTQDLVVTVGKYNFKDPTFIFPDPSDPLIYLAKDQTVNSRLRRFDDTDLPSLSATDNQGEKYTLTFQIEHDLFRLAGTGGSILQISRELTDEDRNVRIPLTITINSEGEPPRPVSKEFGIVFVDDTADPIFLDNELEWIDEFVENTTENQPRPFPNAIYELEGNLEIPFPPIHYVLQDPSLPFTIPDSRTPELHLNEALDADVEGGSKYTVIIQASKSETPSSPNDVNSLLTIEIELLDINDNPPVFESENNYAMFHGDDTTSTIIHRMTATDIDRDAVITYSISGDQDVTNAQQFPRFSIHGTTGDISLASQPNSGTTGYAILRIQASDGVHNMYAELKIFVISRTDHIVKFQFQNTKVECETKLNEIGEVLTSFFTERNYPYQASARGCLDVVDDAGEIIPTEVVAEVYFINTEENEPVRSAQIERFANDITMFQELAREFLRQDLNLLSFSPTTEEEDNTVEVLRAWLIGVAVVLGALCVLLLVAFILKIRSLTNRLNKLSVTKYGSQDSGLNRKIVPNTNRNAVQGSNPVFNTEKTVPEFDQTSIGSGDSDLIGVEDNPEFDYSPPKSNGVANPA